MHSISYNQCLTGMELRHLRYFAAVVDAGGISRAAARLRVTQPALGRQIRDLERELGIRLFDRVGRRIRITADGEDLLRHCRTLLTDAESIVERSRALTSGVAGVLRIGATPQTIESLLVPFMPGFQRTHPGVELQLVEDGGPRLLGHVERGEVHLALTVAGDSRFASRSLFPAVAMAVMSKRHPLARHRTVDIPTLATVPLLLLRREFGTRQWLEGACQAQRVRPRIALESAAPEVIVALAGIGYGVGVVPSTVIVRGPGFHLAPVMNGTTVLGGWFTASWHPRRFFPRFGETFIDALERFSRKSYPGRAIVARAPLPSREPLPIDIMR
jgi:DNA-binding transcriptional LysR family regulator